MPGRPLPSLVALTVATTICGSSVGSVRADTQTQPLNLSPTASTKVVHVARSPHAGEFVVAVNKSQLLQVDQPFQEISVGNSDIADVVPVTKQLVYVLGKQLGSTNLSFIGSGGRVIAVADLVVSYDIEGLKAKLFELMPNERIEIRPANDAIVLTGQVASQTQLSQALDVAERFAPQKVTNLLEVGGSQQVMLQVRFAEVQRRASKALGLNNLFIEGGSTAFALVTGTGIRPDAFAAGSATIDNDSFFLETTFDTLEEKGLLTVLAEPNLVVLSGNTASFLAGGEFPIPVAQSTATGGATAITVEFKEFGIGLGFTPTVIGTDLISLALNTEVSDIDPTISVTDGSLSIPGLRVRRAETSVEMYDGQAFAIAGLISDTFEDAIEQIPWAGDIPILGTLFRSTDYRNRQSELIIFIVPRLVQPVTPGMIASPLDSVNRPSEADLFLFGETEGAPTIGAVHALGVANGGGVEGPHGYIIK